MSPRIGLSTPWDLWDLDPEAQRQRLAEIVDAGVDHVFTADHVSFHGGNGTDGIVDMAAVGGMEPRLGVYIGVYLLALRHPLVAARKISSLAKSAPGRVTVGVGVGGEDRHEFEVCEVDPSTRGLRTNAALDIVRRLLAGETVDGDGRFYHFSQGLIRPTPKPSVPLVVGGRSKAALHRTAALGDGWLGAWCTAERFADSVQAIAEDEAALERGTVDWQHGMQVWVGIGDNEADGAEHLAKRMEAFYRVPFKAFAPYSPCGTPTEVGHRLQAYVDAGASVLNITPVGPSRTAELEAIGVIRQMLTSP